MTAESKFGIVFNTDTIFIELGPGPNFLTLQAIVSDFWVIQVECMLKDQLLTLIEKLEHHRLVWIFDVEHNRLIPDWSTSDSDIRLWLRFVLKDFHEMLTIFQVLSINYVHLKFRITSNTHLRHELSFSLFSFSKLKLDFFLLTSMVDNIPHDFLLPLNQFVSRVQIFPNKFLTRTKKANNQTVKIDKNVKNNLNWTYRMIESDWSMSI